VIGLAVVLADVLVEELVVVELEETVAVELEVESITLLLLELLGPLSNSQKMGAYGVDAIAIYVSFAPGV
jgi:hypothetical protein